MIATPEILKMRGSPDIPIFKSEMVHPIVRLIKKMIHWDVMDFLSFCILTEAFFDLLKISSENSEMVKIETKRKYNSNRNGFGVKIKLTHILHTVTL
jgi:hypothetical protein